MSLNLAQAVMIMGYEWFIAREPDAGARNFQTNETGIATKSELENFMAHLIRACDDAGFLKNPQKRPGMVRNLRHFFQRGEVTTQELNTLHGVITDLARGPHL
jgi:tRNA C32,U32 (ribose-2'-O)-methylase TrmJ